MEDTEKPLKIVHVLRKATYGGTQACVFDILDTVKKQGHTPVLIFGMKGDLEKRLLDLNVTTHHLPLLGEKPSLRHQCKAFLKLIALFRREQPDIVHVHNTKFGLAIELAARVSGCKKVFFTSHGWHHNEDRPLWQKVAFFFMEWLVVLFSTKTIVVSETMYAQAPSFLIPKKLHIIKNGIVSFPTYGKDRAQALLGIEASSETIIFGVIANLHKNKGVDVLIKSFKKLHIAAPNTRLYIIGDGKEMPILQKATRDEKLENAIHFLGKVDNARDYLKAFTVFILPSRTEAFGYSILEAGIAKIPCIATRVGGIPEIIEHKKSGLLVSKDDVQELFLAMMFATQNRKEMESFALTLHNTVLNEYTQENSLGQLFTLYSTPKNS